ncbi:hypothetical protein [Escherichia coli]
MISARTTSSTHSPLLFSGGGNIPENIPALVQLPQRGVTRSQFPT